MPKIIHWISSIYEYFDVPAHRRVLAAVLISVVTAMYTILMLERYWQLQFFFVDNVFFHTALWQMSRLEMPIVYHRILGHIPIFADHFHPTIGLFSILLAIIPRDEMVFIGMAVLYGASAWVGYLIAEKLIKHWPVIFGLLLSFLLYLGSQYAMIYGFHELNLVPFFFLLTMYGWVTKRPVWYWISFALLLLTKESMAVIGVGIGMFIVLADRKQWKLALGTMAVSVAWYLIVTKAIIPYFSDGRFLYKAEIPLGTRVWIDKLINPVEKRQTVLVSLATFGFLPILNIATLPLLIQDFLIRYVFAIPGNVQYTLTYHYGLGLVGILFFSSVWSVHQLEKLKLWKWQLSSFFFWLIAGGLVLSNIFFLRFYSLKGALLMVLNPDFYKTTADNAYAWKIFEVTPKDGTIMTMNHLGVPFSAHDVYPLAENNRDMKIAQPKYIAYDLRPGQGANNYFPSTEQAWQQYAKELIETGQFHIIYQQGSLWVLERNH